MNVPSTPGMATPYGQTQSGIMDFYNQQRRRQEEEERARKKRPQRGDDERIIESMMGGADRGFYDGPISSEMGGLGGSYKTRGNAPRYHEEIPMGGTPGVWAIRNDEIAGPKNDPFQNMSPRDWADSISRGIGRKFRGRR